MFCGHFLNGSARPSIRGAFLKGRPKLGRGLPREFFKDAIELRQRLKADCERDLANPKLSILQEISRFIDADAGDVIDKVRTGHLLEFLAQVIGAHVDRLRDLRQRKCFIRMLADELSRFPDFHRLGAASLFEAHLPNMFRRQHADHPPQQSAARVLLLSAHCQLLPVFCSAEKIRPEKSATVGNEMPIGQSFAVNCRGTILAKKKPSGVERPSRSRLSLHRKEEPL